MKEVLKAIQYKNLDEAQRVLTETMDKSTQIFDDAGEEPQGLLSVIPQDRLPENEFHRLLDAKKGILVEVEKIAYSGYGPPAEEHDYMGFVSENVAYVLKGFCLPVKIENCPQGARDIHHLEAMVIDREHPLDRAHLAKHLDLPSEWDFDNLFALIAEGQCTAEEIDRLIHDQLEV
jgi:hypothetical protein